MVSSLFGLPQVAGEPKGTDMMSFGLDVAVGLACDGTPWIGKRRVGMAKHLSHRTDEPLFSG
jgi:hypothetical protein